MLSIFMVNVAILLFVRHAPRTGPFPRFLSATHAILTSKSEKGEIGI